MLDRVFYLRFFLNIVLLVSLLSPRSLNASFSMGYKTAILNQVFLEFSPPTNQSSSPSIHDNSSHAPLSYPLGSTTSMSLQTTPTIAWIRQFGSLNNDEVHSITVDPSGNIYVAGSTNPALPGQTGQGQLDAFLRKYDAAGSVAWTRQFGSSDHDEANSVAVDPSGNTYVAGYTRYILPGQINLGGRDAFVRKYNSFGSTAWTRQFGSTGNEVANAVTADSSGNIYVVGWTEGAFPDQVNTGLHDAFLRKYDVVGSVAWTRQFGSSYIDIASTVALDSWGNIYVAGWTEGAFPESANAGLSDAFLRKYDATGSVAWTRQFGSSTDDYILSIQVDSSGNIYAGGYTNGAIPGQISQGGWDAFLRKYDSSGGVIWTRQFGASQISASDSDDLGSITLDSSNNIYVVGRTWGTFPGQVSSGIPDDFLTMYDATGNAVWTLQFGSSKDEYAKSVALDSSGNIYVGGYTLGTLPGQANLGSFDAFLIKFQQAIDNTPPLIPTPLSPANGSGISLARPTFSWTDVNDTSLPVFYEFQVATTASFAVPLINKTNLATNAYTFSCEEALISAGTYYWRIKARDSATTGYNFSDWSSQPWSFSVALPAREAIAIPNLISPPVGVFVVTATPTFVWYPESTDFPPINYYLQIATSSTMANPLIDKVGLTTNTYTLSQYEALQLGHSYYWRVQVRNSACPPYYSGWVSPPWSFTIEQFPSVAWIRQFGTSSEDTAFSVAVDSSSNIYVAGTTKGALSGKLNAGSDDAFIVKYNAAGSVTWTRQLGSSSSDYAYSVAIDGTGNAFVVGWTNGALPGQVNLGPNEDAFIVKYDIVGSVAWTRQFGSSSYDKAYSVAVDGSGNIYVAGVTGGSLPGYIINGSYDAFLVKFDSAGSVAWTRQFGSSGEDTAFSVAVASSGNIYVTGWTSGSLPGQVNVGAYDIFLAKFDSTGSIAWTRQFGSLSHDYAYSVTVDSLGNAFIVGHAGGALPGQVSQGTGDAFLVKYNAVGSIVWIHQFGSSSYDYARSVVVDSSGNNYVVGWTGGALPGQVSLGGLNDAFLIKYDAAGSVAWTRQFGSSSDDHAYSIAMDSSGNAFAVGITDGAFPGQASFGAGDAFLVKYNIVTTTLVTPTLLSPLDSSSLNSLPTLDWTDTSGSNITYSLLIDDSSDFSSPLISISNILSSTYTISSNLKASTAYFWKVKALDGVGNNSSFSTVRSFILNRTTKYITLSAGWNMIGLPLSPDPVTAGYQFGDDLVSVFLYNYNPSSGVYDILNSEAVMNIGKGYWIKLPAETTIDLEGIPSGTGGSFRISLSVGWNQVGFPFETSMALSKVRVLYQRQVVDLNTAHSNGWVTKFFYEYNPGNDAYISLNPDTGVILTPFKGYWIKSNVAAELLIPPT